MDLLRSPDSITVITEEGRRALRPARKGIWEGGGVELSTSVHHQALRVALTAPKVAVKQIHFHWRGPIASMQQGLGDAWERGYGDLEWRRPDPARVMPWYFMAFDGKTTHGYGVKTGGAALCYWKTDDQDINLCADVRCGGTGVQLGARQLEVGHVVCRRGAKVESPFQATRAFCQQMCPQQRLPKSRVYGTNDWYYAYGNNSTADALENAQFTGSLSPKGSNRPYAVIDDGWAVPGGSSQSSWDTSNNRFPSMPELARDLVKSGAKPGIWVRPLLAAKAHPHGWRLQRDANYLDPTLPEVRQLVHDDIARIRGWGYELIKHDYSTFDLTGKWGFQMGADVTNDGWAFANRGLTTAEVILDFYQTLRQAANHSLILGCNAASHLAAGIFELNRTGDDTSGKEWERTRKMGVNTLAFRAPQHDIFYAGDADCIGLTKSEIIPWTKNRQWLDLVARSGTPLFLSLNRHELTAEQKEIVRDALAIAAQPQPGAEPLDWMATKLPSRWKLMEQEVRYDWR